LQSAMRSMCVGVVVRYYSVEEWKLHRLSLTQLRLSLS
jgi:hypothetical protein